jgi:hypothetical protein
LLSFQSESKITPSIPTRTLQLDAEIPQPNLRYLRFLTTVKPGHQVSGLYGRKRPMTVAGQFSNDEPISPALPLSIVVHFAQVCLLTRALSRECEKGSERSEM